MKTYHDLVQEAKTRIREVSPAETMALQAAGGALVLVDCREPNEWNLGHAQGAVWISRGNLEQHIERHATRDQTVVLYCASGNRSALAADTLRLMGFTDVASMSGGFRGWIDAGGEVED